MTEQLISYETAKLAKEKGFNELCEYIQRDELDGTSSEVTKLSDINLKPTRNSICARNDYAIPSQSLLQKWLREEHYIYVLIKREEIGSDEWEFAYEIEYLPKEHWEEKRRAPYFEYISLFSIGFGTYSNAWSTYEEALEAGLLKALTLIS
jgi:uncharacterized protein YozE (UPF0346 family)